MGQMVLTCHFNEFGNFYSKMLSKRRSHSYDIMSSFSSSLNIEEEMKIANYYMFVFRIWRIPFGTSLNDGYIYQ